MKASHFHMSSETGIGPWPSFILKYRHSLFSLDCQELASVVCINSISTFNSTMFVNSHGPAEFCMQRGFTMRVAHCFSRQESVYLSTDDNDFLIAESSLRYDSIPKGSWNF